MEKLIPVFEKSLLKANQWLNELKQIGDLTSTEEAFLILQAVLYSIRDRLFLSEAILLSADMPMLIRGMYFAGWNPAQVRYRQKFVTNVQEWLSENDVGMDAREAINIVFKFLKAKIIAGEIEDIKAELPEEILMLWKDLEAVHS